MKLIQRIGRVPVYFDETAAMAARAVGFWPRKAIIVGPKWNALTPAEREAVLWHEAGHCRALHLEKRVALLAAAFAPAVFFLPGRLLITVGASLVLWELAAWCARRHELEADRYAVDHGHGVGLVTYLARPVYFDGATDFYPSHAERIDAIVMKPKEAPCSSD